MRDWNDLRYVLAVARSGSITAAAATLKVSHSTVSRRIGALEKKLGVRLFERRPDGFGPTPPGADFLNEAAALEQTIEGLDRRLRAHDARLSGPLRVTAPPALAATVLMPYAAAFMATHPEITVTLTSSDDIMSLARREADVAIRVTHTPTDTLVGRKLAAVAASVYASRDYLARHTGGPHRWIRWDRAPAAPSWQRTLFPDAREVCVVEAKLALLAAVRAGIGIGELPCWLGDTCPDLQRMGKTWHDFDLWVLAHADLAKVGRVRAFTNFLAVALAQERDLIEGRRPTAGRGQ